MPTGFCSPSIMVTLKRTGVVAIVTTATLFTINYGDIKTVSTISVVVSLIMFTINYGDIKTQLFAGF